MKPNSGQSISRQQPLESVENFELEFAIRGHRVSAAVTMLDHRAIEVLWPKELDERGVSMALERASLHGMASERTATLDLRVASTSPNDSAQQMMRATLEPADDASSALLWKYLSEADHDSRQGAAGTAASRADRPPRIPGRGIYTEEARLQRLEYIRETTSEPLESLQDCTLDPQILTGNIENMVGRVEIPVGLAGPMTFLGDRIAGPVHLPMATSEGALVASATRGATAITRAGGVTTYVISQRMLRVPLFVMRDMQSACLFARWVKENVAAIRAQIETVSRHAQLITLEPRIQGRMAHVEFVYETGDAAGQNMTTTCTWQACQWMMLQMQDHEEIHFDNFIIEANMSGDKKVNFNSLINGRGTRVMAEAYLEDSILKEVLKVDSEMLLKSHHGFLAGSIQVGTVGYNINVSNIVGAVFAACGQDVACVHESSLGILHLEPANGGIYASMLMPSLIVGTVGGGTNLPNQRDCLAIMGCAGTGHSARLAEIIAGYALALDLSTLAAIASGQFATAHERLGRNRPVQWLEQKDLDTDFFTEALRTARQNDVSRVIEAVPLTDLNMGSTIITELTARNIKKLVGHYPYRLTYTEDNQTQETCDIVAKIKPIDHEVILMINSMAAMCGGKLASYHEQFKQRTGFAACHRRELGVYAQTDPRITRYLPEVYGIHQDDEREAYVVVLELLRDDKMVLKDSADDVSGWERPHIEAAIRGLAEIHSVWYGRDEELKQQAWLGPVMTSADMMEMQGLWEALKVHAIEEFPELISPWISRGTSELIRSIGEWWPEMEAMPRTLIHNDFNPRNICLRPYEDAYQLVAYDWELATLGLPQRDLAEFLAFVLHETTARHEIDRYVELHRTELERHTARDIDPGMWREGYRLALWDLAINRMGMYMMAHTFRHYAFIPRVVRTARRLVQYAM